MSDNQKPSRDTGEEVCEVCGDTEAAHENWQSLDGEYGHPYTPAPKAPVREVECLKCGLPLTNELHRGMGASLQGTQEPHAYEPKAPGCPRCEDGGWVYDEDPKGKTCPDCKGFTRKPKVPVSEDRLDPAMVQDWLDLTLESGRVPNLFREDFVALCRAALKSKEKP